MANQYTIFHGDSRTNFYSRFTGIKRRCIDKNNKDYKRYGAKGIKFEWKCYEDFKRDMYESFLRHCKKYGSKNTSIDRIDGKGNYSKKNCRWATIQQQSVNKSSNKFIIIKGKRKTYAEWARIIGCSRQALRYRVIRGLDPKLIISLPFKHSNKYAKTV